MNVVHHFDAMPAGLKSAAEAEPLCDLSELRLVELANAYLIPHYRVDGGPPLFLVPEVRKWVAKNLLRRFEGSDCLEVKFVGLPPPATSPRPECLAQLEGLRELSPDCYGSGIYFLCRGQELRYIGQSVNVAARIEAQARQRSFDRVFFLSAPASELDAIESRLIHALCPPENGRDCNGNMVAPIRVAR